MLNPAEFEKFVDRRIDFITSEAICRAWASEELCRGTTGINGMSLSKAIVLNEQWFGSKKEIEQLIQRIGKEGAAEFALGFCSRGERYGEDALLVSNKVKEQKWKGKTTAEVLEALKNFDSAALKLMSFMWSTHPIAKSIEAQLRFLLAAKISDAATLDHTVAVLTFPTRENTPVVENRELMKISVEIASLPEKPKHVAQLPVQIKQKLQLHSEKFGFLGSRGAWLKPWNIENLFRRCLEMASDLELRNKIEKSNNAVRQNRAETEKIEKELQFTAEQRKLVEASKEIVYFRTYRTEVMYHIYSDIESLLEEVGKRFSYKLEEVETMSTAEILNLPTRKVERKTLEQRSKVFAILQENGKVREIRGEELEELQKAFTTTKIEASELRGTIACRGKVSGKAKVVLTSAELDKVNQGDILITSMTTPDFVPAMQRAAAFVTNEGGITCHAAIISREMNKPCVIATKVATKTFKDGDTVEVDADEGIVKKVG